MSFEITGRITEIFPLQQVTDTFKKREFILEIKETNNSGFEFVEYIKFQTIQDKCNMLDTFNIDEPVKVSFNLRGRKWEKDGQTSYFTNLDAWRIEKNERSTNETLIDQDTQDFSKQSGMEFDSEPPPDDSGFDDLPF